MMVTVETAGITTGVYGLDCVVALGMSEVGEAGDSKTGEAGDSKMGEAGESLKGEEGDSTIVNAVGESLSGESGGANKGESSPLLSYFLQEVSRFSVSENLGFLVTGSTGSSARTWPLEREYILIKIKSEFSLRKYFLSSNEQSYDMFFFYLCIFCISDQRGEFCALTLCP